MSWVLVIFFATVFLASVAALKTRVAVVGFQKNEVAQLDFWLAYHVALFGANNIAVLDNYSTDKDSLKILRRWAQKGVLIMHKQGPYEKKGELTAKAFKKLFPKHQLAIPLDIDEILVSYRNNLPVVSKKIIHGDVERFWKSGAPCGNFRQYFNNKLVELNDTVQSSPYFHHGPVYGVDFAKKMVRMERLSSFDHGNHYVWMKSKRGKKLTSANCSAELDRLGLLHYAQSEPIIMLRKAILDSIGFGYFPSTMTAENLHTFGDIIERTRLCALETGACAGGRHKLQRVIYAYDHGVDSLFSKPGNVSEFHRVGNFAEILAKVAK